MIITPVVEGGVIIKFSTRYKFTEGGWDEKRARRKCEAPENYAALAATTVISSLQRRLVSWKLRAATPRLEYPISRHRLARHTHANLQLNPNTMNRATTIFRFISLIQFFLPNLQDDLLGIGKIPSKIRVDIVYCLSCKKVKPS